MGLCKRTYDTFLRLECKRTPDTLFSLRNVNELVIHNTYSLEFQEIASEKLSGLLGTMNGRPFSPELLVEYVHNPKQE